MRKLLILALLFVVSGKILAQADRWQPWQPLPGHRAAVSFLHFGKDYLFSGDASGQVMVWKVDGKGAALVKSIAAHKAEVSHLEVSPDGTLLYTAGYDGYVRAFRLDNFREAHAWRIRGAGTGYDGASGDELTFAVPTADGKELFAGGYNQKVKRLDLATGSAQDVFSNSTYGVVCGEIVPGRNWLAFGFGGEVRFFNIGQNKMEALVLGAHGAPETDVCEVAYEPSRDLLAVWLVSGSVRLYSLGSGKLEATIPASKREGSCRVGLAPGAGLLAAGNQPQATLYRLDTRRPVGTLVWHKGTVGVLAFGKGEQVLATGADNGELMLWKLEEEEEETPVVVRPPVPTKPEEKPGGGAPSGGKPGGAPSGEAPHDWLPKDDVVVGESMVMEGLQFDQSSYILRPEGKAELDKVVAWMKKYPRLRISLEGHTSNEGDPARNLTLSRQRVESAKNYLLDRGLGEDRIETQAYGETRPVADNKTAAGRAKNRRIELRVLDF